MNELRALRTRVEELERRPIPQTIYDQYPTTEWAAIGRGVVPGNSWSSCGIANVTGLKFDRVEIKFITDRIYQGRSEAEVRLAAFRHSYTSQTKTCVSASDTWRIKGETPETAQVGIGKFRWVHGLGFGWEYDQADSTAVYTIELQHRLAGGANAQKPDKPAVLQMYGYWKSSSDGDPYGKDKISDADRKAWAPALIPDKNNTVPSQGWVDVQDRDGAWDGSYRISNMHYCVGVPQDRLPDASAGGWFWYSTKNVARARDANTTEPYFSI
ncbi:hypothetical protein ACIP5N_27705 [Streptomyces sp. NPDC088768]|uniref:hypothetical protein n=1 Tax=Streptomyces sp. NPDC088768 TaxID=3365894 RepID=UPI00382447BD